MAQHGHNVYKSDFAAFQDSLVGFNCFATVNYLKLNVVYTR